MTSFIIDEEQLRRLSPAARRELMGLLSDDVQELRAELAENDWDPEGSESYPLDSEEASLLVRGMPTPALKALKVFIRNTNDNRGHATLVELLEATGYSDFHALGDQFNWLLLRLRTVTHNEDAWVLNWGINDWEWDEKSNTYTSGEYFISRRALDALAEAIGD